MNDVIPPPRWWRLIIWMIRGGTRQVWYTGAPVVLVMRASPAVCLHTLMTAAKPSTSRLHLRNLFAHGRRYFIQPQQDGFQLTTTSKVIWRYRQRTSSSAVLDAHFSSLDDDVTRIQLRARLRPLYMLSALLIPAFMTTILVYVPWHPALILAALAALYGLSWAGHRLNAALEVSAMVWFVQKALEDLVPAEIMTLGALAADQVVHYDTQDFEQAWEKFYEQHSQDA